MYICITLSFVRSLALQSLSRENACSLARKYVSMYMARTAATVRGFFLRRKTRRRGSLLASFFLLFFSPVVVQCECTRVSHDSNEKRQMGEGWRERGGGGFKVVN